MKERCSPWLANRRSPGAAATSSRQIRAEGRGTQLGGKPVEQGAIHQYATIGAQLASTLKSDPSAAHKKAEKRFVDAIQTLGKLKKAKK